jgi:hypothetical protein
MSENGEWFAPKRYGYGTGLPISWEGWAILIGYVALVIIAAALFRHHRFQLIATLVPLTLAFIVICAKTTRGGWRWRWGEEE